MAIAQTLSEALTFFSSYGELRRARHQSAQLQRIATALARAIPLEEMADLAARECGAALGADAVCLYLMRNQYYELVAEYGCTDEFKAQYGRFPKELLPMQEEVYPEEMLFCGSANEFKAVLPLVSDLVERSGRKTIAYAPLAVDHKPIGFLGFSYNTVIKHPIDRSFVLTMVNLCAQALERVRLTAQERAARQEAEAANLAKSDFLANISHEIRTPIGIILGFVELLQRSHGLSPHQQTWVRVIDRNIRHLNGIIGEVLDISRIEAGSNETFPVVFSLSEMIEDIEVGARFFCQQKGITFNCVQENLPQQLHGDPNLIKQVLLNLIDNAIKFTTEGAVELKLTIHETGSRLEARVRDTGIGIAPEYQNFVFAPFNQVDSSTRRRFGGVGLGLSIAKRLATAMGGDVQLLESVPQEGSTFLFSLPLRPKDQTQTHPPVRDSSVRQREKGRRDLNGKRILVVEDSQDNRDLLGLVLRNCGATVETAESAITGIPIALKGNYDTILMDIQMPEMDGYEAAKILRKRGLKVPIVALTAHALASAREKSVLFGFSEYLTKPINFRQLIRVLKKTCSQTSELGGDLRE
ncbi:MAG: ATP-binding protein [Bdellovibrionales bacterium]